MKNQSTLLEQISVASPCTVNWDEMTGDDHVRFCGQCELNVHNLSHMSRNEAETLVAQTEGKRCIRFYRREDGTMLTKDCPKGFRAKSRHLLKIASVMVAGLLGGWMSLGGWAHAETIQSPNISPEHTWGPEMPNQHIMGQMIIPERPPYHEPPTAVPVRPIKEPVHVTPQKPSLPKQGEHKSEQIQPFVRFSPMLACDTSDDAKMTTMALGEEGGKGEGNGDTDDTRVTTMALGEEGGKTDQPPPVITEATDEDGQRPPDKPFTSMALGEEGGVSP